MTYVNGDPGAGLEVGTGDGVLALIDLDAGHRSHRGVAARSGRFAIGDVRHAVGPPAPPG